MSFKVKWIDGKRSPQSAPDHRYPNGVDLDMRVDADEPACRCDLPYPAKRCGVYMVECRKCSVRVMVTTAGRTDDPRTVHISCKKN